MIKVTKFGAAWCGPCKLLDPILHELKNEFTDVKFQFVDVDTDEGQLKATEQGVMGIPRVMIYKNDEKVVDFTGYKPKEFVKELIVSYI